MNSTSTPSNHEHPRLTPALAFLVALTYMAGADGVFCEEEEGILEAVLKSRRFGEIDYDDLLVRSITYYQQTRFETFLKEAAAILSEEQKLCVLINLADTSFADGSIADEESELFDRFLAAFGLSETHIRPYLLAIQVKNNLAVFKS